MNRSGAVNTLLNSNLIGNEKPRRSGAGFYLLGIT